MVASSPAFHTPKNMPATNELLQEGRYRINQQISLDGSGNLYEAYDTIQDTNVVVKEIVVRLNRVTTMSQQESMKTAFANQAKILSEITHDSLLHVHDYFSEIGRQYLVMESVDGDDLAELLERNRSAFAVTDVVDWADQILDALNYLHTFQPPIIHKNVRPQHIKLNSGGRIKLLAFGLADGDDNRLSTTLTGESTESVMSYSPLELIWEGLDAASQKVISNSYDDRSERILKEPADARSDIYSLGATLYHLVTGRVPIDPLERSIELLDGNPDPLKAPHKVDPRIPTELSEVLMRALEIKRENRFDSAVIMRQVVRTAMVRVHEREAEEAREQEEAAEDIRMAEEMRRAQTLKVVQEQESKADTEQKAAREQLKAQISEAESQRLLAEKRAAEAADLETKQREEAASAAAEAAKAVEAARIADEQAKVEAAAAFEAAKAAEAKAKAEAEAEAMLKELNEDLLMFEVLEDEPVAFDEVIDNRDEEVTFAADDVHDELAAEVIEDEAEVVAYEAAAEAVPQVSAVSLKEDSDIDLGGLFSEQTSESSKGIGMPAIAGIAAVVLILAIGGWLFMSSGPAASSPAQVQVEQTVAAPAQPVIETPQAPVVTESAPVQTTAEPTTTQTSLSPSTEPGQPSTAARPAAQAPTPKPKKTVAEPAKPAAEKKKAVTVDDLIGDN